VGRSTSGTCCGGRAPSSRTSWRVAGTPPPRAAAGDAVGRQGSAGVGLPPALGGRDHSGPWARASAIVVCCDTPMSIHRISPRLCALARRMPEQPVPTLVVRAEHAPAADGQRERGRGHVIRAWDAVARCARRSLMRRDSPPVTVLTRCASSGHPPRGSPSTSTPAPRRPSAFFLRRASLVPNGYSAPGCICGRG
jgi:hypothetical protein